jgi:hypothetical protein
MTPTGNGYIIFSGKPAFQDGWLGEESNDSFEFPPLKSLIFLFCWGKRQEVSAEVAQVSSPAASIP